MVIGFIENTSHSVTVVYHKPVHLISITECFKIFHLIPLVCCHARPVSACILKTLRFVVELLMIVGSRRKRNKH